MTYVAKPRLHHPTLPKNKLGYTQRDSSGFRLLPNGQRLGLIADVRVDQTDNVDRLELIKAQWAKVGVELSINTLERSIVYERVQKNQHEISIESVPGGLDPTLEPRSVVAVHTLDSRQGIPWTLWYESGGTKGKEPPESMKKRMALLDKWKATPDQAKADAIYKEILQIAADEFEIMGIASYGPVYSVRNKHLRNVLEPMPSLWMYPTPGPSLPQTWYYDNAS